MSKLQPIIKDIIFRRKIVLHADLVDFVHKETGVPKDKIEKRVKKLLKQSKIYSFQEQGLALQDFGDDLEKRAKIQVERIFFEEYVFANPTLESGKELCDLLVYFDNKLVLLQAKTAKFTGNYERFVNRVVSKSISQLKASINRCQSDQVDITLTDIKGREVTIDKENLQSLTGIVLVYQIEPVVSQDKARLTCGELLDGMDRIPHILSFEELTNLLTILDTPWDFLDYLDKRESVVSNKAYTFVSEGDLLSFYYRTTRTMVPTEYTEEFDSADMIFLDGFEEDLATGELAEALRKRKKLDKPSFVIDHLIERAKECPGDYQEIIQRLHGLNRVERRAVGIAGLEKYSMMMESGKEFGFRLSCSTDENKLGIILVFSKLPQEETRERMKLLAAAAKYKKKLDEVIVISHRPYDQKIQQNDFVLDLTEYERPDEELEKAYDLLWGTNEEHIRIEEFSEKIKRWRDD